MTVKAEARYTRVSAQKARLVVDLIRGRNAGQAVTILKTTNKRIAPTRLFRGHSGKLVADKKAKPE